MFLRYQLRLGAMYFASLFVLAWGTLAGARARPNLHRAHQERQRSLNAVINFSSLVTNSPVSSPGTNLTSSPPAITFQAQDDDGILDPPYPGGGW